MPEPYKRLNNGSGTIPTAGTRVQIATAQTPCGKLTLTALDTNSGTIVYGGSTVVAAAGASRSGTPLVPGQSVDIEIDGLEKVWLDATVSGDGYSYTYLF